MSKPITLNHSFRVHGSWWLPSAPAEQISGTLVFEPGNPAELELSRCFSALPSKDLFTLSSKSSTVEMIAGRSDEGIPWFAGKCLPVTFGLDDVTPVTFLARYCLAGYNPPSNAAPSFSELHIHTTHLAEWVQQLPKQYIKMPTIQVKYSIRQKSLLKARVPDPAGVLSLVSWSYPSYAATEMRVHSEAKWIFWSSAPIAFQDTLTVAQKCRDFLTLMVGKGVDITRLLGECERRKEGAGPVQGQTETVLAEMIVGLPQRGDKSDLSRREPRIRFDEIPKPAATVKRWFNIYSDLDEVIGLILAAQYVRGYTTTEFLNLTQALEAFHRRTAEGAYYPTEEYEGIRQMLVDALPTDLPPDKKGHGDFRKNLISSYQYANQYSFRTRLRELCTSLSPATQTKVSADLKLFVNKIVTTRNYLTHLDRHGRPGTLVVDPKNVTGLWQANIKLTAIATIQLLKQIGVAEEIAANRAFSLGFN